MRPAPQREYALLRAATELEPDTARQPFLDQACQGNQLLRFARRNRVALTTVGAFVAVQLWATVVSTWQSAQFSPDGPRLGLVQKAEEADKNPARLEAEERSPRRALHPDPLNAEAWRRLAREHSLAGQTAEALQSSERALELQPGNREAWELKGDLLALGQRPVEALEAYRRCDALISGTNLATFQARVGLLPKRLGLLQHLEAADQAEALRQEETRAKAVGDPIDLSVFDAAGAARREDMSRMVEEVLKLGRHLPPTEVAASMEALGRLEQSCVAAGQRTAAAKVLEGYVEGLRRWVSVDPANTIAGEHLALLHLWLGETEAHKALCQQMLSRAADSNEPTTHDRAAKAYLLRVQPDSPTLKQAVTAGRKALQLGGPGHTYRIYFVVTAGMAACRDGTLSEAESLLSEGVLGSGFNPNLRGLALAFRAMARARLGRTEDARTDLGELEKQVLPLLPAPTPRPLSRVVLSSAWLSVCLAYEDAKAVVEKSNLVEP